MVARDLLVALATAASNENEPTMTPGGTNSDETSLPPEALAPISMDADFQTKYKRLFAMLASGYSIICLLSTLLVFYMHRNRTVALRGDMAAAQKTILPAYTPLLQLFMVFSLGYTLYFWITRYTHDFARSPSAVESEVYYAGRVFFVLLTVVYLLEKSVTLPALRRATLLSIAMSTYNIPVVWLLQQYGSTATAYWIPQGTRCLLVALFIWVFVSPPARATTRTIREYCIFVFVYYMLYFAYSELFRHEHYDAGFLMTYANILWGSLCPLVIWRVLRADTEYWRGLGRRACDLQVLFRQRNRMDERISSRGLHVLIEMHRKHIIDFAHLDIKRKVGVGASAVVFNGILHSKTAVAIKVYTPTELTEQVVAEFSHEAALCGALHHPNIVQFHGMCVYPPAICLVFELCQGSLDDITQALARRSHDIARQQLMINLNYMIDATRAVAYLHSFSPAFVHRDIKPSNFLIDRHSVVKLTDFGESRSLPHARGVGSTVIASRAQSYSDEVNGRGSATQHELSGQSTCQSQDTWPSMATATAPRSSLTARNAMTVRGTAEYMAPEVIQGKAGQAIYGEAADIFSLTMTLWDIVYPLEDKYPEANGNHLQIFASVLDGQRPAMSTGFHPGLRELFISGWSSRPDRRPSALNMLNILERIQQEVGSDVATVVSQSMDRQILISQNGCTTEETYTGRALVQKMLGLDFVASVEEGVRVGNGLMSAGLLHHTRHLHGFNNTEEMYTFDEARLQILQHTEERFELPAIVERGVVGGLDLAGDGQDTNGSNPTQIIPMQSTSSNGTSASTGAQGGLFSWRQEEQTIDGGPRRMSASSISAVTISSTNGWNTGSCLCRQLGAGMMYISKHQHHLFRWGKKNTAITGTGAMFGGALNAASDGFMRQIGTKEDNVGLTAKLLLNEFTHSGDGGLISPTTSVLELTIHDRDESEDEIERDI